MRPLNGSLFTPKCALRVNLASVREQRRSRLDPAEMRRHLPLVVITSVTVAGWSSPNEKIVPRRRAAAVVRPCSGVEILAAENTALVSARLEMVGRVLVALFVVGIVAPGGAGAGCAAGDIGYS
jgi:hypothetical protein